MGGLRYTRTFTRYFSEEDTQPLVLGLAELAADFEKRAPHIDADTVREGTERLEAARLALARLLDRVVE